MRISATVHLEDGDDDDEGGALDVPSHPSVDNPQRLVCPTAALRMRNCIPSGGALKMDSSSGDQLMDERSNPAPEGCRKALWSLTQWLCAGIICTAAARLSVASLECF